MLKYLASAFNVATTVTLVKTSYSPNWADLVIGVAALLIAIFVIFVRVGDAYRSPPRLDMPRQTSRATGARVAGIGATATTVTSKLAIVTTGAPTGLHALRSDREAPKSTDWTTNSCITQYGSFEQVMFFR